MYTIFFWGSLMNVKQKDNRVKNGVKTSKKLITVAKEMFSKCGYADTFTSKIAQKAGVTRGALYHHFPQKKDLFVVVFDEVINDFANRIIFDFPRPLKKVNLMASTLSFIDAGIDPVIQRIIFTDGPTVLGIPLWRQYDKEKLTKPLEGLLEQLIEDKVIKPLPVDAIAHIMAGATNEAVRWISNSHNPKQAYEKIAEGVELLYESFWV
jgi:AcrR family transcriptional regulator